MSFSGMTEREQIARLTSERDAAIARAERAERERQQATEAHEIENARRLTDRQVVVDALALVSGALGEDDDDGSATLLDVHERVRAMRDALATERAAREKADADAAAIRAAMHNGYLADPGVAADPCLYCMEERGDGHDDGCPFNPGAGSALLARLRAIETAARALSAALESPPWSNAQATGEQSAPTGEGGHDDWIRGHKHALWQFAQAFAEHETALRAALASRAAR